MMRCCHLYHLEAGRRVFSFEAAPVRGVDICNRCGACLVRSIENGRNGEDGREHSWIVFSDEVNDFLKNHDLPVETADRIREIVKEAT